MLKKTKINQLKKPIIQNFSQVFISEFKDKISVEIFQKIPSEVKLIFEIFGDEIFLVGGCVRDMIVQKEIKDYDFATSLTPKEIVEILKKNNIKFIDLNAKFATIIAVINKQNFQITTFRSDKKHDGRHCEVEFSDDIRIDASRRDFSINAIYLDRKRKIYDFFNGVEDLKKNKVRFIGKAEDRIKEDYLRILRFFRFSVIFAKSFDIKAIKAIKELRNGLSIISQERIRDEFIKIINIENSKNLVKIFTILNQLKISDKIFSHQISITNFLTLKKIIKKSDYQKKLYNSTILMVLFYQKNFDSQLFFEKIRATKEEKKFINFFIKNLEKNIFEIKLMLLKFSAEFLINFYFLSAVFNGDFLSKRKVISDIDFIENFAVKDFFISAKDLIELGFIKNEIDEKLKESFEIWLRSDRKLSKNQILLKLKN